MTNLKKMQGDRCTNSEKCINVTKKADKHEDSIMLLMPLLTYP